MSDSRPGENNKEMFCRSCGKRLPGDSSFCPSCGKPVGVMVGGFNGAGKESAEREKEEKIGLIAFIFLLVLASLVFWLMSVSWVGWILGILAVIGMAFLQRKLAEKGCFVSIILWILTLLILILILIFTSASGEKTKVGEESSKKEEAIENYDFTARLPYEKTFVLNDGKSIGRFRLFVSDGTGRYENYKGQVICEFYVKFDTSSLPADFKMRPDQATERDAAGGPALDGLIMAVCSDTEAYHLSSLGYAEWIYNNGNIRPYLETDGATTNVSPQSIKEMARKYPKMQVLRYNENEVGMTKEGENTWVTHSEKAFGLHPPVVEGSIPWDEILSDLGLK